MLDISNGVEKYPPPHRKAVVGDGYDTPGPFATKNELEPFLEHLKKLPQDDLSVKSATAEVKDSLKPEARRQKRLSQNRCRST